jgi:hypothetical protein
MHGATPPLPQYVFMAWCLVKRRDNFTFNIEIYIPTFTLARRAEIWMMKTTPGGISQSMTTENKF